MIKVSNLTKIYDTNKETKKASLDNVSFTLPDKGLVFIVGKSGSGKTTLLNLLGGLDNITSGNIDADGISFKDMTIPEFQRFRATYLGFVFQDFCLIDSINIFDNIKISLDIINKEDNGRVDEVIKSIGLEGYDHRYPNQLSAGQKQRVAIARAIVKKPKLILCDEPTGNLDSGTSKQILNLIKELSKECLVVVVSHNMDDAYLYADRIIELSDGRIIYDADVDDKEKNLIVDKTLYLGNLNNACKEEIDFINNSLQNGSFNVIKPRKELYNNVKNEDQEISPSSKAKLNKTTYPIKKSIKLGNAFMKKRIAPSAISSFFTALIVTIFGLCQMFSLFDVQDVVDDTLAREDERALVMKKATRNQIDESIIDTSYIQKVNNSDKKIIEESKYQGDIYTLYSFSLPISCSSWRLQSEQNVSENNNFLFFYAQETYGVLLSNEELTKKLLNVDNLEFAAKGEEKDYGIYITDYVADSILHFRDDKFKTYDDLLGEYYNDSIYSPTCFAYINGIIKTGYAERYKDLIDDYLAMLDDTKHRDYKRIVTSEIYLNFIEEAKNYLDIAYTFNPNFIEVSRSPLCRNIARFDWSKIYVPDDEELTYSYSTGYGFYSDSINSKMTISVSYEYFGSMIGEQLTYSEAVLKMAAIRLSGALNDLTLEKFAPSDMLDGEPRFKTNVLLTIHEDTNHQIYFSKDLFELLRKNDMIEYAYYLDDTSTAGSAYLPLSDVPFVATSKYIHVATEVSDVVGVFTDFYTLVSLLLCLASLFVISSYAISTVNRRKKDIGILKALGASSGDLTKIFIYQILLMGLITSILYTGGLFIFKKVANNILIKSFEAYSGTAAVRSITIINFNIEIFLLDIALILGVTVIAALIPLLITRRIKPLNIIKAKD